MPGWGERGWNQNQYSDSKGTIMQGECFAKSREIDVYMWENAQK
jgi:hypothetical protein